MFFFFHLFFFLKPTRPFSLMTFPLFNLSQPNVMMVLSFFPLPSRTLTMLFFFFVFFLVASLLRVLCQFSATFPNSLLWAFAFLLPIRRLWSLPPLVCGLPLALFGALSDKTSPLPRWPLPFPPNGQIVGWLNTSRSMKSMNWDRIIGLVQGHWPLLRAPVPCNT